jgi:hypothetical protein
MNFNIKSIKNLIKYLFLDKKHVKHTTKAKILKLKYKITSFYNMLIFIIVSNTLMK